MNASEPLSRQSFKKPAQRAMAYYFYLLCVLTAIAAAAVLVAADVQAQTQIGIDTAPLQANKDGMLSLEEFGSALNRP